MSDQISIKDVNKALRNISRGPDLRHEMALVTGADANWEEFLVPGPICIAIMGDLMLTATVSDFTLDKNPPKNGFQLLNHPKSFRACLMQVVDAGYNAFSTAHKNMHNIRLRASNSIDQVKQAAEILLRGTDDELEHMLPVPLGSIKDTSDQCLSLAKQVDSKFQFVMDLTAELLEVCVSADGANQGGLKDAEIALAVAKESKVSAEERNEMAKKNLAKLEKMVTTSEKAYYKAMESMPSGWSMIRMAFVEGITNAFVGAISGSKKQLIKSQKPGIKQENLEDADIEGYSLSNRMVPFIDNLVSYVCSEEEINLRALEKTSNITYCKQQLENILRDTRNFKGVVIERVRLLCLESMKICKSLEQAGKQFGTMNPEDSKTFALQLLNLQGEIKSMSCEGKVRLGANPTDMTPPKLAAYEQEGESAATQQAVQNARFKIAQTSAHLRNAQENYDKSCDRLSESSKKLHEIIAEMKKLDIQEKSLKDIKETLAKGIRSLGELREKWGKIVMFFQMMSNIVECSLSTSLKGFLEYSRVTSERSLAGYSMTSLKRDMLYQQAFEAAKIAHVVTMISGSYVEISQAHLMERIAGLGKLLSFDPEKDKYIILRERRQLFEGCEQAQDQIRLLVLRRKEEFNRQINARLQTLRRELDAVIPPIQDGGVSQKKIEDSVNKAIEKVKEAEAGGNEKTLGDQLADHYADI